MTSMIASMVIAVSMRIVSMIGELSSKIQISHEQHLDSSNNREIQVIPMFFFDGAIYNLQTPIKPPAISNLNN